MKKTIATLLASAAIVTFTGISSATLAAEAGAGASANSAVQGTITPDTLKTSTSTAASGSVNVAAPGTSTGVAGSAGLTGDLTVQDIDPSKPFGDIPVTPDSKIDATTVAALSADQNAQLKARCQLIADNKDQFDAKTVAACDGYLKLEMNAN